MAGEVLDDLFGAGVEMSEDRHFDHDDLRREVDPSELPTDFVFYRAPLRHQLRDFMRYRDKRYFGLFYEQRARKTKVVLDVFRYRYERGEVDALLVIAYPNGVHRVWLDELSKDFPPETYAKTRAEAWRSGRSTKGDARLRLLELRDYRDGPIVVTFNCESIIGNQPAAKYFEWFVHRRRVMLVADESAWLANWSKRTQRVLAFGRRPNVVAKAILDGTPVEEGPGEIFFPTQFLRESLLGYPTAGTFRARYFEYEEEDVDEEVPLLDPVTHQPRFDPVTGASLMVKTGRVIRQRVKMKRHAPGGKGRVIGEYEVFKGYRHLPELFSKLFERPGPDAFVWGSRVRRADVSDAPPKTYQSRYFELTDLQRRVYDDLRDRYVAELHDGGSVTAANVLLRMTRLQMIARNYFPPEKEGILCGECGGEGTLTSGDECARCEGIGIVVRTSDLRRIDPKVNPAIDALKAELAASKVPTIIWCRFRQDVRDCLAATRSLRLDYFQYDGSMKEADREAGYQAFRAGEGDGIVGTIASGLQRGKDLRRAGLLVYYSNDFALRSRRQSEDRAESLEKTESTGIVDLVAADTRDLVAIEALREKRSIAEAIMGDPHEKWI